MRALVTLDAIVCDLAPVDIGACCGAGLDSKTAGEGTAVHLGERHLRVALEKADAGYFFHVVGRRAAS